MFGRLATDLSTGSGNVKMLLLIKDYTMIVEEPDYTAKITH